MTNTENLLIALSEFIADRKEGIQSGVYEIECRRWNAHGAVVVRNQRQGRREVQNQPRSGQ
jgi:hypothetical protein